MGFYKNGFSFIKQSDFYKTQFIKLRVLYKSGVSFIKQSNFYKTLFIKLWTFYKSRVGFIKLSVFIKVKLNTFFVRKLKCLFWHKEICFDYIK